MGYLAVEGDRKIYFEHHAGAKMPVVLIHGWAMSCRVWDTTLSALQAKGHAVVSFDQRGCGLSDKDFREVSVDCSGTDVVKLLHHLGLKRVVVNGWSLGGAVAVCAASQLGRDCAGVVLTAGASPRYVKAPDFPHGGDPGSVNASIAAAREDRTNFFAGLTKAVCAVPQSADVERWLWSIFMQTSPAADNALLSLESMDQRAILGALDVPLLSVVGGKDVFVAPEIGRIAAKHAMRGQLVEFPECGHAPFLEVPSQYRDALLNFLERVH
jgi:pimeloyl-[acyl-carrier protein] methyl ester esterase